MFAGKDCDVNNNGTVTMADVMQLTEIFGGSVNAGELCDGLDNDCDGNFDEVDSLLPPPSNSQGVCANANFVCNGTNGRSIPDFS